MALDLESIRIRCEAATPGPWTMQAPGPYVHDVWASDGAGRFLVAKYCSPPDARFIAHARQDIDDLLAEVERLRGPAA